MENFKEQIKKIMAPLKEFWGKLEKKTKKLIAVIAGVVLLCAVGITLVVNLSGSTYVDLYPDMSQSETAEVYAMLKDMDNVKVSLNNRGVIQVQKKQKPEIMLQLAARGYPTTTLTYDTFLDNTSFTMTDSEKKQLLIYQLNDRLQSTIKTIEGVDTCVVNLNIVTDSGRVWEQSAGESSASILVGMKPSYTLSPERVTAIKNLAAYAIPNSQLKAENVKVIDAASGTEIDSGTSSILGEGNEYLRLQYEREVEKQLENKIKELLSPMYGSENVTAVVTVKLNYDKVVSEENQIVPGADGNGYTSHFEEDYTVNNGGTVGGVVGEENNTDIPTYPNLTGDQDGTGVVDYHRDGDYQFSTVLIQTEHGQAVLEYASASVLVQDKNFTAEKQKQLKELIRTAVNIIPDRISVESYDLSGGSLTVGDNTGFFSEENRTFLLIAGASILGFLLIFIIIILIANAQNKKRKKKVAEQEKQAQDLLKTAQEQLEERKRALTEAAQASSTEQNGLTNDIRSFAKSNPEIAASLIRSMLKEDE